MAVAGGPLLAPIVAGAMLVSNVSWRWTEYVRVAAVCQYLCHTTDSFLLLLDDRDDDACCPHGRHLYPR